MRIVVVRVERAVIYNKGLLDEKHVYIAKESTFPMK